MRALKDGFLKSPLRVPYLWAANRWRQLRRLFAYPETAQVGVYNDKLKLLSITASEGMFLGRGVNFKPYARVWCSFF